MHWAAWVRKRIHRALAEETARLEGLQRGLDETRAATEAEACKASEAATQASQAQSGADEASTKATAAAARADAAGAVAKEALGKATETDQRLTTLWAGKDRRTLTETLQVHFEFDKWVLNDGVQTRLLALVKQLHEQSQLSVELEGYTDSTGPSAYNIQLRAGPRSGHPRGARGPPAPRPGPSPPGAVGLRAPVAPRRWRLPGGDWSSGRGPGSIEAARRGVGTPPPSSRSVDALA
jgi:outer membrane protein OmpA-like peptidoglycan-associated protein